MRSDPKLALHVHDPKIIWRARRDDFAAKPGDHEAETQVGPIWCANLMLVDSVTFDAGLHLLVIGRFHQFPFGFIEILLSQL